MTILTDRGADLSAEQRKDLDIEYVPLRIQLGGKTYVSGIDIDSETFYQLLAKTDAFPTTSQPSAGEIAEVYRRLHKEGKKILSVHISSGLSGTFNAASAAVEMVPEADVEIWDSKTLSAPLGWQVELAAKMQKAGASNSEIMEKLALLRDQCDGIFTLDTLKYLIHGGRISHIKGLLASVLNIKPVIGVDKVTGKYAERAKHITLNRAIAGITDVVAAKHKEGARLRVQLLHGYNPEGLAILKEKMDARFDCVYSPTVAVEPVLGAHTGAGLIGLSVGPAALFDM
ncbi:MAG TPA: DegV family protein [Bellilinea sp.]|nr:DegV family protein [Bellilinea sp.]